MVVPEIIFLVVQVRRNVVAEERKEACNCKSFIAVTNDFEVYGVIVVEVGEEGDDGIDGDHEDDSDDTREWSGVSSRGKENPSAYCFCSQGFR